MPGGVSAGGPNPWQNSTMGRGGLPPTPYVDPEREFDASGNKQTYTGTKIGQRAGDALKALHDAVPDMFAPDTYNASGAGGAGAGGPQVPQIPGVDNSAANANIFARAKDKVGEVGRSALTGLRSALGGRGMLGSGAESKGTASIVNKGQGELGDTVRQSAITDSNQSNANATTNYGGAITQRGQDIQAQEENRRLSIQQQQVRQQQLSAILDSLHMQLY